MLTFQVDHFDWLSQFYSEWRQTSKLVNFQDFYQGVRMPFNAIFDNDKYTFNSVPLIKKTLVNHVYIRIWSFWLTFTVLQWMKTNFKLSQFSRFLMRPVNAIYVKIWSWLKLLNSVPFIKKTLLSHVYIHITSFWLTFADLQWMMRNFKFSQFSKLYTKVWVCDLRQSLIITKTS